MIVIAGDAWEDHKFGVFSDPKLDISFESKPLLYSYVVSIYFQKYSSKLDRIVSHLGVNMFKNVSNHKVGYQL